MGQGAAAIMASRSTAATASILRRTLWQEPHWSPMPQRCRSRTERAPSSMASEMVRSEAPRQMQTIMGFWLFAFGLRSNAVETKSQSLGRYSHEGGGAVNSEESRRRVIDVTADGDEPEKRKPETRNQKPETRNQKPETRNPETRNPETPKPRNPETQKPRNQETQKPRNPGNP